MCPSGFLTLRGPLGSGAIMQSFWTVSTRTPEDDSSQAHHPTCQGAPEPAEAMDGGGHSGQWGRGPLDLNMAELRVLGLLRASDMSVGAGAG